MKKIMSVIIIMSLLLIGCSSKDSDKKEESKQEEKEKTQEQEKPQEENEVKLNHNELLQNNRNSITGDYVSPSGEVVTINSDGTLIFHENIAWDPSTQVASDVSYREDGTYEWGLNRENSIVGGVGVIIYPIGIDVKGMIIQEDGTTIVDALLTNTDTIRMVFGNGVPNNESVYTKK